MDFRVLGPLEVADGGEPRTLGGAKQRALLALLLLNAGHTLSSARLVDEPPHSLGSGSARDERGNGPMRRPKSVQPVAMIQRWSASACQRHWAL